MKVIPNFLNGKNFTNKEVEKWGNDWRWRLTPESRSKVLTEWRLTSVKPKAETSEEYTKRRIKEESDKSAKETKWMRKTADALHTVGTAASGVGLAGSMIINPVATIGAIIGGTVGDKAVDKAVLGYTGDDLTTWAKEINNKLGLRDDSTIGHLSNPGAWIGGGLGVKGASLGKQGINTLIRMDMPRYGYTPTTPYYFEPEHIGMNGVGIRKPISEIFEQERWNRFRNPKYVTEADRAELESHFPEYKTILERAMDEGNYLIIPENSPLSKMSTQLDDGRLLFTGDEGTWILSLSENFRAMLNGTTTKIGFKGGTDLKGIEGVTSNHAPETFPNLENGVFFAGPRLYADTYNHGQESPGFWLFFRSPYNMLDGGKRAFPLEDNTVRFVRGVMSSPSYRGGEVPILTYNTINKAWNAEYLNNPEIVEFLSRDPNKMSPSELIKRDELLRTIRQGLLSENEVKFNTGVESMVRSGKLLPLRSLYYDGFIGRDHALGWSPRKDFKWPFGSNPETYVIFHPELAKLLVGNNGAFSSLTPAYSRKKGGKLNRLINKRK